MSELKEYHLTQDSRIEEEKKAFAAAEEEKKKRRKVLVVILPIVFVVLLVLAAIPSWLIAGKKYSKAEELLAKGEYDKARVAFTALIPFGDSKEQVDYNIDYTRAADLLKEEKYEEAKDIFDRLTGYKDAADKSAECQDAIDAIEEAEHGEEYRQAVALMNDKKYLEAKDAFMALGKFKDCRDKVNECMYLRAASLLDFAENNNCRKIFVKISDDAKTKNIVSMPSSALLKVGSNAVIDLKNCFGQDGTEIMYEDEAAKELKPICEAIAMEFEALGNYKDSADLAVRAKEAGDFTKEFFDLVKEGDLEEAAVWLRTYDDEFPEREEYSEYIELYLPYCGRWQLQGGDSTLVPATIWMEGKSNGFIAKVTFNSETATLILTGVDLEYTVALETKAGDTGFMTARSDSKYFFTTMNNMNRIAYIEYADNNKMISSVEYEVYTPDEE